MNRFLLASSAGDGWDLDPQQFNDLLVFARHESYWAPDARFFVAALGRTTADVIRRAQAIRSRLGDGQSHGFVGIAACPPVQPGASQAEVLEHYHRVAKDARLPVAIYQLPQVTGCMIEPATLAMLLAKHPNIVAFKDSSGTDSVVKANFDWDGAILLRGAEGHYADSLRSVGGHYDGLLIGSANVVGYTLRNIIDMAEIDDGELARRHSGHLTEQVASLFEAVQSCLTGNPSSNFARAVDHLLAHGLYWSDVEPPLTFDGSRLPRMVIDRVASIYNEIAGVPERGYFIHREAILG